MSAAIDLGRSTARVSDLSSTAAALRASAGHSISSARIADSLAAACHLWGRSDYTIRRETLVATSQSWGYSCATLGHSLDAALAPFTAAALRSFAAKVRPHPELIGFIMPGNVVSAGLHEFCLALIAGAAVIVKSASAEPLFFARFAGTLAEIDRELADRIAILNWNRSQAELTNAFASLCDCVAAFGDDQTIATLRSQRPIIAFGSRLSGVVAGCDADPAVTSAIARDVSLFEQRGCLSPHHIFVEDRGDGAARALARDLAAALECLTATLPPPPRLALQAAAPIRRARETARWRKFAGEAVELWEGGRLDWTVIYDAAARFCASPGYRTVFVSPFRDRSDLKLRLAPAAGRLEAFALALPAARQSPFEEDLRALGATHLCKPGAMQSPPLEWRHGGGAFLERLLAPR